MHRAMQQGAQIKLLVTMMIEDGERSRSHGLSLELLKAQAEAIGIEHKSSATSWADYETSMVTALKEAREQGIQGAVFGDIDIQSHREWEEKVCAQAQLKAFLPLWQEDRRKLIFEFIDAGFKAVIIAAKDSDNGKALLGRTLDRDCIAEIESRGWDAAGENGEYHTVVTDGPIFSRPLKLTHHETSLRSGYHFLNVDTTKNRL